MAAEPIFFELSRDRGSPLVEDTDEGIIGAGRVLHEGPLLTLVFDYKFATPVEFAYGVSRPARWTMLDVLRLIRVAYLQAAGRQGRALGFNRQDADGLYIEAVEPLGEGRFRVAVGT